MKLMMIAAIAILMVTSACAQKLKDSDVPVAVKTTFSQRFPSVKNVKWSKESGSEFEAEFKSSIGEQSANFDVDGKWLITETEVEETSLPVAVAEVLKRDYSGYTIKETEMAEKPGQPAFYEIEIEQGKKKLTVQISPDGKLK